MDELVIDDKKYVSSKQAAKLTGYAKDYVGQLCREGRVQAQLVGRAWYVLESAIQDHRFGSTSETPEKPKRAHRDESSEEVLMPVWEAPRYVPSVNEILPQIKPKQTLEETDNVGSVESIESWSEWRTADEDAAQAVEPFPEALNTTEASATEIEADAVSVRPADDHVDAAGRSSVPPRSSRRGSGVLVATVRLAGALLVLASLSLVAVNSGYLDKYIVSVSQAWVIEGISVYNRPFK